MASKLSSFLAELKRRKVYRVAAVYAAAGAAISIAIPDLFGAFGFPEWAAPLVIVIIVIGFPVALILAWAYEVRPEAPKESEPTTPSITGSPEDEERKSIVVLPFDNMSPDSGDAYFSDGLTEEIITHLSYVRSLRVISRNSAMALKGTQKSTRAIAEELGVQFVLEGSVRKAGSDLRITAQLIDAPKDMHLWAEKYTGTFDDVFEIQETVARSIVDALKIEVTSEEEERIADRPIEDLTAYESYLKAKVGIYKFTEENVAEAVRHLHQALDAVGDNATLYAGLALAHFSLMNLGVRIVENRAKAEDAARKALALDPDMPKARALLGLLLVAYRGTLDDIERAARHLQRALEADPDDVQTLWGMCVIYMYVGRPQAAYPLAKHLRETDPLDPYALWPLPTILLLDGKYDMALREFRRLHEEDPEHVALLFEYAMALAYNNALADAVALVEAGASAHPDYVHAKLALIRIRALQGDKEGVLKELEGPFYEWARERFWATRVAAAFALLDERDEALDWLEHAVDQGFINYPWLSKGDLWLENIRGEERFRELMVRVKHEWDTFEI